MLEMMHIGMDFADFRKASSAYYKVAPLSVLASLFSKQRKLTRHLARTHPRHSYVEVNFYEFRVTALSLIKR